MTVYISFDDEHTVTHGRLRHLVAGSPPARRRGLVWTIRKGLDRWISGSRPVEALDGDEYCEDGTPPLYDCHVCAEAWRP